MSLLTGIGYFLRGFKLIMQPGMRRFVVVPLAINILVFGVLVWLAIGHFDALLEWLVLPPWLNWLEWLLWPLLIVAIVIVILFSFTLLANLIGSPFNGLLAERVEAHLTGHTVAEHGWGAFLLEVARSPVTELRKILYFILRAIPLLILFLIPVLNVAAPFLWIAFSAWMLALQYADYPMANHGLSFFEQRQRLGKRRLLVLGFGGATLLTTFIPVVNFVVMPVAVAGATVMWVEQLESRD